MDELIGLMSEKDYISGEKLCQSLQLTRGAVWKRIQKLRAQGYVIVSAGKRGYMLSPVPDSLLPGYVARELTTGWLGRGEICYQPTVGSTNAWCKEMAREGARCGTVCLCDEQTMGRGRLGRVWDAQKGQNLLMSVLLRPKLTPESAQTVTLAAALATALAIDEVTGLSPKIKWPNDLLCEGKKLTGILVEMSADMDRLLSVVVGIGVNVNQTAFPEELQATATSLKLLLGHDVSRRSLMVSVLKHLERTITALTQGGFAAIAKEYERLSLTLHQDVTIKPVSGEAPYEAKALSLDDTGALIIGLQNGQTRRVISAEVSVRGGI